MIALRYPFVFLLLLICLACGGAGSQQARHGYDRLYLEYDPPDAPGWGWVRPGDIDGDGDTDIVAGGGRRLYVYENPGDYRNWRPRGNLDSTGQIGSNGCVLFDVDRDGDPDVVSALYRKQPGWWENPGGSLSGGPWHFHPLDSGVDGWYVHDILSADIDGDGRREELIFNFNRGYWEASNKVYWYRVGNDPAGMWDRHVVVENVPEADHGHAGLDAADIDGDGRTDIAYSNGWFRAPVDPESGGWEWEQVSTVYGISNTQAADIDLDGDTDLVMAAGHHGKGVYWYANDSGGWTERVVDSAVVNPEGLQVLDVDGDGRTEILAAELFFGERPLEPEWSDRAHSIYQYLNRGGEPPAWERSTVSSRSWPAHGLLAADVNRDGRTDLLGNGCGWSVISYYEARSEPEGQQWWDSSRRFRATIDVNMAGRYREERPVEVPLDFAGMLAAVGADGAPDRSSLRLVEKDAAGRVVDSAVQFQLEPGDSLLMVLTGRTGPNTVRQYDIYFDTVERAGHRTASAPMDTLVRISDGVMHEEQESFRITTPSATWYYHKAGAGFASMEDVDGKDWLGYRPCCESGGEYRGIPNMWKFHPGKDSAASVIEIDGPLRARIRSVAIDGSQECIWDIFPRYARMTLLQADKPYWFLYEGIPGGSLEVDRDYNVISNGLRRSITEDWHGDLPSPEWVYFGDDSTTRTIFLAHDDDSHTDQFWQMRGEMVVFGFGREYRCCGTFMERTPAHFFVGFAEDSAYAAVSRIIDSAWRPVQVKVGRPEKMVEAASRR